MKYLIIIERTAKAALLTCRTFRGVWLRAIPKKRSENLSRRASSYISRACERLEIPFRNLRAPPSTSKLLHDLALI